MTSITEYRYTFFMIINEILEKRKISKYKLSKLSGVPYSTVSDICNEKVALEKCSAETVYLLAKALNLKADEIIAASIKEREDREKAFAEMAQMAEDMNSMEYFWKYDMDYENFKSNTCHQLKNMGDLPFIMQLIESDAIMRLYKLQWNVKCLYLLALLDYLCRVNNLPKLSEYGELRKQRIEEPVYSRGITIKNYFFKDEKWLIKKRSEAIEEFAKFNIYEGEVRDVE
ncbi:MAG: helix-turn-helix transcriptional regulator [Anaerovoracaceae bacterium]